MIFLRHRARSIISALVHATLNTIRSSRGPEQTRLVVVQPFAWMNVWVGQVLLYGVSDMPLESFSCAGILQWEMLCRRSLELAFTGLGDVVAVALLVLPEATAAALVFVLLACVQTRGLQT